MSGQSARASRLEISSYAKINLDLRLGNLRHDGYHDISTVTQIVELHDSLSFSITAGGFQMDVRDSAEHLPPVEENIIFRAFEEVRRYRPFSQGIAVTLTKRIPMGAGLGGGSSNACCTIAALNRLLSLSLSDNEQLSLCASLGSDVSLFFHGGRVLAEGRGEKVTPLPDGEPCGVVIVKPPFSISTKDAYRWWDEGNEEPLSGMCAGPFPGMPAPHNDFEKVLFPRFPLLARIKQALRGAGCDVVCLTGSGSALYGLVRAADAAKVAGMMTAEGFGSVMATRTMRRGDDV